jgi:O-antigen/teichoic acid export membrane protein
MALLLIPASLSMSSAIATFVPKAKDSNERRRIFFTSLVLSLGAALAVSSIVTLLSLLVWGNSLLGSYIRVFVWVLPFMTVSRNVLGYYQGNARIQEMARFNVYSAAITLALVTLLTNALNLTGWLIGRLLGETLFAAVLLGTVRRDVRWNFDLAIARTIVRFGLFASLGFALDRLISTADTLYLAYIQRDPRSVAVYGIASIAYLSVLLVPAAVSAALYPRLARLSDTNDALRYAWRIMRANVLLVIPIAFLAYFSVPVLAFALFGATYQGVAPVFHVMALAIIPTTMVGVLGVFFFAQGRADLSFYGNLVGAAGLLLLDLILIPKYGVIGAAIGVVLASVVRLTAFAVLAAAIARSGARPNPDIGSNA